MRQSCRAAELSTNREIGKFEPERALVLELLSRLVEAGDMRRRLRGDEDVQESECIEVEDDELLYTICKLAGR